MSRRKPIVFLASAAAVPLIALAVAACGGGGSATASPPPKAPRKPAETATVRVANSSLGRILVNSTGQTLYLFKADSSSSSACSGKCAIAWPPLRTDATPTGGSGANAALVGTILRSDGTRQATYDGHPLYTFRKDRKPGDVNGQGKTAFGAAWFVVSPAGNEITSQAAGNSGASSPTQAAPAGPYGAPSAPPASSGIPQNNGGDGDSDNNGAPSDRDGNI